MQPTQKSGAADGRERGQYPFAYLRSLSKGTDPFIIKYNMDINGLLFLRRLYVSSYVSEKGSVPFIILYYQAERSKWRFIGQGEGIHWEAVDEDLNVEGLLAGRPSGESQRSFQRRLSVRQSRQTKA